MSKKTVCDRCGADVKHKPDFAPVEFPIICIYASVKYSVYDDTKEFDLCDDCKKDLIEWLSKGKEAAE